MVKKIFLVTIFYIPTLYTHDHNIFHLTRVNDHSNAFIVNQNSTYDPQLPHLTIFTGSNHIEMYTKPNLQTHDFTWISAGTGGETIDSYYGTHWHTFPVNDTCEFCYFQINYWQGFAGNYLDCYEKNATLFKTCGFFIPGFIFHFDASAYNFTTPIEAAIQDIRAAPYPLAGYVSTPTNTSNYVEIYHPAGGLAAWAVNATVTANETSFDIYLPQDNSSIFHDPMLMSYAVAYKFFNTFTRSCTEICTQIEAEAKKKLILGATLGTIVPILAIASMLFAWRKWHTNRHYMRLSGQPNGTPLPKTCANRFC